MERDRVHAGYGDHESGERETAVRPQAILLILASSPQ